MACGSFIKKKNAAHATCNVYCKESGHSSRPSPAAVAKLHGSRIASAPLPWHEQKHCSPTVTQSAPAQRNEPSATVKHISSAAVMPLTNMKDGFSAAVRALVACAQSKTNEQTLQAFMLSECRFEAKANNAEFDASN